MMLFPARDYVAESGMPQDISRKPVKQKK